MRKKLRTSLAFPSIFEIDYMPIKQIYSQPETYPESDAFYKSTEFICYQPDLIFLTKLGNIPVLETRFKDYYTKRIQQRVKEIELTLTKAKY